MESILDYVKKQVFRIRKHIDLGKPLSIEITDAVCALDFKEYAKKFDWNEKNKFEAEFADASNVLVSIPDFIKYSMQYTDLALEIENKFSDRLDELRDLQRDAAELLEAKYCETN